MRGGRIKKVGKVGDVHQSAKNSRKTKHRGLELKRGEKNFMKF